MASVNAYRLGAAFARHAPQSVQRVAASTGGFAAALSNRQRRLLVRRNLERATGRKLTQVESVKGVAATFDYYARYFLESFQLPTVSTQELDDGFAYEGVDNIERAVRSGIGPILVMPHLGTWEWAAWWLAQVPKMNVTAVVEPLEPPEVFEWFLSLRNSLGMEIIAMGPDAGGQLAAAINKGNVICLLSDRDIAGNGIIVDFFGERTRLPAGPAMLALRTGAPLIPAAVYWGNPNNNDGFDAASIEAAANKVGRHARGRSQVGRHAIAMPPLDTSRQGNIRADVERVTQDYAHALEQLIAKAPTQWHLMSPNWPSDYEALGMPIPPELQTL